MADPTPSDNKETEASIEMSTPTPAPVSSPDDSPAPTPSAKAKEAAPPAGDKKVMDTLSKPDPQKDKKNEQSWVSSMNELTQGWSQQVSASNDALTRKIFGATLEDFWDDPTQAAKAMEDKFSILDKLASKFTRESPSDDKQSIADTDLDDNEDAGIEMTSMSSMADSTSAEQQVGQMDTSSFLPQSQSESSTVDAAALAEDLEKTGPSLS